MQYQDIIVSVNGGIGTIKLNRPASLNAFGGDLLQEMVVALRELDENPQTIFTVLTGEGRFFSAGADVKAMANRPQETYSTIAQRKLSFLGRQMLPFELFRSMVDHKKVLVVALNGPAVGGGAAWFVPVADIVLCAENAYLAVPFSALGLVPELGSAQTFLSLLGPQRTNEFLMLGRKLSAQELEAWGIVARVLPQQGFQDHVMRFLEEKLDKNDGKSMMEAARLVKMSLRNDRILAAYNSIDAISERFATGAPQRRFRDKAMELQAKGTRKSLL